MGVLDKYELTTKPPKVGPMVAKYAATERIRKTFLAGLEKQKAQAKAWKPGANDFRSWVTRDEERGLAWVTVRYGAWAVPIKGKARSTIGPVKLSAVPKVFDDFKKAAQAGELDASLWKVAFLGPRKKKRPKAAKGKPKNRKQVLWITEADGRSARFQRDGRTIRKSSRSSSKRVAREVEADQKMNTLA